jgi:hypothetical protein
MGKIAIRLAFALAVPGGDGPYDEWSVLQFAAGVQWQAKQISIRIYSICILANHSGDGFGG